MSSAFFAAAAGSGSPARCMFLINGVLNKEVCFPLMNLFYRSGNGTLKELYGNSVFQFKAFSGF